MQSPESTLNRAFVYSRLIDAPRERVFRAFAQSERLAGWWGPDGFRNTFSSFDVGGRHVLDTVQEKDAVAQFVGDANEQNLNRLEKEVKNVL